MKPLLRNAIAVCATVVATLGTAAAVEAIADRPASGRTTVAGAGTRAAAASTTTPFVSTLITHAKTAPVESAKGLKMAMLEVNWKYFEPQRRVVDRRYAASMLSQFRQFRAAGMRVTLGLGLHFTPKWVLATRANHLVDQHGTVSSQADFIFNRNVRLAANWYLKQLNKVIPLKYFWAVRVTSGGASELLYPTSSFWAWSAGAQKGTNRPTSLAPNPRPGWKPGQKATEAQRRTWAHWYIGALADVADWQMSTVHALGFRGYYQVLTPGQGLRTKQWNALMRKGYGDGLLGRGAAWNVLYLHLRHRKNVTAYVSSLADGTADASLCTSSDKNVSLSDPRTFYWSGARWITRIAHQYGLTVAGEPAGYPNSVAGRKHYADTSSKGLLAIAMRQARSCGMLGVYWAHDTQVQNGTMPLSALAKYTSPGAAPPRRAGN